MNGKWIEIFKIGRHTDNKGRIREWTEGDLNKMVTSYDPKKHEAPAVIGHPTNNAPAYGWVESLKAEAGKLYGKFKQIQPAFADMVSSGSFKKRSISIYPDGSLRHVGFLGAMPPAIKGLADIQFSGNDDCSIYEFEEQSSPDADPAIQKAKETEMAELDDVKKQLEQERQARAKAETEAAAQKKRADDSAAAFSESQVKAKRKAIADFVEAGIKDGKILPAWKAAGITKFMETLDGIDGAATGPVEIEFSEGKGKMTPAKWFRDFISSFSEHPLFKEMTRPEGDKTGGKTDEINFSEGDGKVPLTHKV